MVKDLKQQLEKPRSTVKYHLKKQQIKATGVQSVFEKESQERLETIIRKAIVSLESQDLTEEKPAELVKILKTLIDIRTVIEPKSGKAKELWEATMLGIVKSVYGELMPGLSGQLEDLDSEDNTKLEVIPRTFIEENTDDGNT